MPRDGAIIFGDLIGKLGMLRVERAKCGPLSRRACQSSGSPSCGADQYVVNLMDALRRSVETEKPERAAASKPAERKKPAKRRRASAGEGRAEGLLTPPREISPRGVAELAQ